MRNPTAAAADVGGPVQPNDSDHEDAMEADVGEAPIPDIPFVHHAPHAPAGAPQGSGGFDFSEFCTYLDSRFDRIDANNAAMRQAHCPAQPRLGDIRGASPRG